MSGEPRRGSGTTSAQLALLPQDGIFVWCSFDITYPRSLCKKLGREDIQVVSPSWLSSDRWRGRTYSGVSVDHAAKLQPEELEGLQHLLAYVRRPS